MEKKQLMILAAIAQGKPIMNRQKSAKPSLSLQGAKGMVGKQC